MSSRMKKLFVLFLSATMTVTPFGSFAGAGTVFAEELTSDQKDLDEETSEKTSEEADEDLVLDLTFDDEKDGIESNGYTAKIAGDTKFAEGVDGNAVYLKGDADNYITIEDSEGRSPLTDLDEFTVSYDVKPMTGSTCWSFFATPNTSLKNGQSYQKEKYLGILSNGGSTTVERYNNTGSRPSCPSVSTHTKEWNHVDIAFSKDATTIYVNGQSKSSVGSKYGISDLLGKNSVLWIGHANWGDGESMMGYIDNFKIYSKAVDESNFGFKESKREDLNRKVGSAVKDVKADYEDNISVKQGEDVDLTTPASVTFDLNGKEYVKKDAVITWHDSDGNIVKNTKDLDNGTYELTGNVSYFGNPIVDEKADPYVIYNEDDGYYYFTSSWPAYNNKNNGYDRIALRKAKTLEGLADAEDHVIWWHHTDGTAPKYHIWAPELHKVNGNWYVYFAASASASNEWDIHPYVLCCSDPDDLLSEDSWSDAKRFTNADGSYTDNFDNFDLDMTTFNLNGTDYVIWAHKPNVSYLKLGVLDSEEPWHLKEGTETMILTTPEYDWEMNGSSDSAKVNEGPAVLKHDGKLYVTYSASTTGPEYCMGMMSIDIDADLFDISNWTKSTEPVLQTSDLYQQYGPGHNSFTEDKDGNVVIVYHARDYECYSDKCDWANADPLYDPCRNANLAYVRFAEDGTPVFSETEYKETSSYTFTRTVKVGDDETVAEEDAKNITINGLDDVRGNITLPVKGDKGSEISWKSSDTSVITDKDEDGKAAGVVTRPAKDTDVTLTATVKSGEAAVKKTFTAHVKAKAEIQDTTHYLFAHFTGEGSANGEQIYFADSEDGLKWTSLNEGKPVVTSKLGEKGLRDPFIIRSPEGDKFYMIATDLKINGGNGWTAAQTNGSQSIMVWESTDLVNWGSQRMVKVAADNAGCTWAPEAFYNEEEGNYFVFWASKTSDDNYGVQRVYYAETRDFYTFTEPKLWIELHNVDGDDISVIDTSVIKVGDTYYRISKDEAGSNAAVDAGDKDSGKFEILEKASSLKGNWTRISSKYLTETQWVEGGTFFKFNGENKWCLLLDNFGGKGYFPAVTTDIESGEFTELNEDEYSFPSTMRHGTVIPITTEEYEAVEAKWGSSAKDDEDDDISTEVSVQDSKIADIDFDGEEPLKADGLKINAENGYTTVSNDAIGGNGIELSAADKQWLDIKKEDGKSVLSGLSQVAVNYWSKVTDASSTNKGWTVFAANNGDSFSWPNETYFGVIDTAPKANITDKGVTVQRFNDKGSRSAVNNTTNVDAEWKMVTVVATEGRTTLYVNGKKVNTVESEIPLADLFGDEDNGALQIGKANWNSGEFFNGEIDNVSIYNRGLTADEVTALYKSYTEKKDDNVDPDPTPAPDPSTDPTPAPSDDNGQTVTAPAEPENNTITAATKEALLIFGKTYYVKPGFDVKKFELDKNGKKAVKISKSGLMKVKKSGVVTLNIIGKAGENQTVTLYVEKPEGKKATVYETGKISANELITGVTYAKPTSYTSSDEKVAKVDADGVITVLKKGSVKITAVYGDKKAKAVIKLKVKIPSLNKTKKSIKKGSVFVLKVRNFKGSVTWTSSDTGVATVDADGNVYGAAAGTAVITAKNGDNVLGTCKVTVK